MGSVVELAEARKQRELRRLAARQKYVHPGWDMPHRMGGRQNPAPAPFKKGGRKPVKGGRWGVRRLVWAKDGRVWSAYTRGSAKALSARFATQVEAAEHATKYANQIAMMIR